MLNRSLSMLRRHVWYKAKNNQTRREALADERAFWINGPPIGNRWAFDSVSIPWRDYRNG